MNTYLECVPCFFQQALRAAELAGATCLKKRKIINRIAEVIPEFSLRSSPPEMGRIIYTTVKKVTGKNDPYKKIKEKSNREVKKVFPLLKRKIRYSKDSLLMAVKLAIAGNVIDYGAGNLYDIKKEIHRILKIEKYTIHRRKGVRFDYRAFRREVLSGRRILYLADNAGETFFDLLLIEEIKQKNPAARITYAVKSEPIINDALIEDACRAGINKRAEVIATGADAPGAVLSLCSRKFKKFFREADIVISKGQGNFEALSSVKRPVFFLFMVKCPVVASDIGLPERSIILYYKK